MTREEAISKLNTLIRCVVDRAMIDEICHEIIEFLESQMPRVMTLEEVVESKDWMWCEYTSGYCEWCRQNDVCELDNSIVWNDGYIETLDDYAQRWRCWTSRPSPEQMSNTPWDVSSDEREKWKRDDEIAGGIGQTFSPD